MGGYRVVRFFRLDFAKGEWTITRPESDLGWVEYKATVRDAVLKVTPQQGFSKTHRFESGEHVYVRIASGGEAWVAKVTTRAVQSLSLQPGRDLHLLIKAHAVHPYRDKQ